MINFVYKNPMKNKSILHQDLESVGLESVGLESVEIWKSRKIFRLKSDKNMSFLTSATKSKELKIDISWICRSIWPKISIYPYWDNTRTFDWYHNSLTFPGFPGKIREILKASIFESVDNLTIFRRFRGLGVLRFDRTLESRDSKINCKREIAKWRAAVCHNKVKTCDLTA